MGDLAEDRVYQANAETTEVYVAAGIGVVRVEASGERVGGFGVDHRCDARDVAAGTGVLALATDEDVLRRDGEAFRSTGFGPAVAVGVTDGRPIAAAEDGRVGVHEGGEWVDRGGLDADVRAIDADLLATDDGVFRLADGGVKDLGLDGVRDVAAGETPMAATERGLHVYDGKWRTALEGDFRTVSAAPGNEAHAATSEALFARRGDGWEAVSLPGAAEEVVGVAYGECPYAVTAEGTLLTGDGEWRPHPLGVRDVVGIAVR